MRGKIIEHLLSIILVSAALIIAFLAMKGQKDSAEQDKISDIRNFLTLPGFDYSDPFHRALLKDVMNVFYPGQEQINEARVRAVIAYKEKEFTDKIYSSHVKRSLSIRQFYRILAMYLKFLLVYLLVLVLTYYGVQTIAVYRFVRKKAAAQSAPLRPSFRARMLKSCRDVIKFILCMVLFAPAYTIAYSMRTEFNTDTVFFLIILGVVSNGLLITYANKFYAFLVSESRKGYVETALAKNLNSAYSLSAPDGIPLSAILRPIKIFSGHVFDHIFRQARFQYLSTVKEQASFLITGLVIIEMALNIHGHLCYEMLQQLLYGNNDIVILIVLLLFFTVKGTEIASDVMIHREGLKYENRPA